MSGLEPKPTEKKYNIFVETDKKSTVPNIKSNIPQYYPNNTKNQFPANSSQILISYISSAMIILPTQGVLPMKNNLICPICGEPTYIIWGNARNDRLCKKHGMLANAGVIKQCPDCGKWHKFDELCDCKKQAIADYKKNLNTYNQTITTDNKKIIGENCLDCGAPSHGYFSAKSVTTNTATKAYSLKLLTALKWKF